MKKKFTFRAKVWIYKGSSTSSTNAKAMQGAWHFVTLPKGTSDIISKRFDTLKRGWGSLRVEVTIGKTTWKTSIFPDKKLGAYVLPIKADVREKEGLKDGDSAMVVIEVLL